MQGGLTLEQGFNALVQGQGFQHRSGRRRRGHPRGEVVGQVLGSLPAAQRETVQQQEDQARDLMRDEQQRRGGDGGECRDEIRARTDDPARMGDLIPVRESRGGRVQPQAAPVVAVAGMPELVPQQGDPLLRAQYLPQRQADREDGTPAQPNPAEGRVVIRGHADHVGGPHPQLSGDPIGETVKTRCLGPAQRPLIPPKSPQSRPQGEGDDQPQHAKNPGQEYPVDHEPYRSGYEKHGAQVHHTCDDHSGGPRSVPPVGRLTGTADLGVQPFDGRPVGSAASVLPSTPSPGGRGGRLRQRVDVPVTCRAPGAEPGVR